MFEYCQNHVAYNLATGEILTTNRARHLNRWVKRHDANDRKYFAAIGQPCPPSRWVFAHGGSYDDCIAKLTARGIWG
jgi:hypothetical protein